MQTAHNGLSERQQKWIDCTLNIAEMEDREGRDHRTSHWVFIRKVLGEPRKDALPMAAAFRHVRLTRESCEHVAIGWDEA